MTPDGTTFGTVVRWDDARRGALIEARDLPGGCWADADVVVRSTTSGSEALRAGQVVELDWAQPGAEGLPFRALRVAPRDDLQQTVGG